MTTIQDVIDFLRTGLVPSSYTEDGWTVRKMHKACTMLCEIADRDRWIPVEERLPEDNRNVLVVITEVDGSPVIDFGYYIPGDNVYEGWQTNYFMSFGKVTHWREMLAPPECEHAAT